MTLISRRTLIFSVPAVVATGAIALPTQAVAEGRPTVSMHQNSRHPAVKEAQRNLIRAGYSVGSWGADGVFGYDTDLAASHFQTANSLWRDGIIGSVTWPALLGVADDKPGRDIDPRSIEAARREGSAVDISMKDRQVRYLTRRSDGSVKIHIGMEVRFGGPNYQRDKNGEALKDKPLINWPTDKGSFRVYYKKIDEVSRIVKDSPMPYSVYYNGGEAVHYSPSFKKYGYSGNSHGCVNASDEAQARHFFEDVAIGTRVIVH